MRAVKDIINSVENEIKTKSRKSYQALSQSLAHLQERIGTTAGKVIRKSPRSKSGGQK